MDVSKRIQCICKYINGGTLADIGTDHCYLPIFAIEAGLIEKAIGIDINSGPLEKAKENVIRAGLAGKIELRLGSGFSPLVPGECTCAVLSGLGGVLIAGTIGSGIETAKRMQRLVLSPQSDGACVRKTLHKCGFYIHNEDMVLEGGKYYPVIIAQPGEDEVYGPMDYIYGKRILENPNDDFKNFLKYSLKKNDNIINHITTSANPHAIGRKAELTEENEFIRRWFRRW